MLNSSVEFGVHWVHAHGWVVTGFDAVRRESWTVGTYRWRWMAKIRLRVAQRREDTE